MTLQNARAALVVAATGCHRAGQLILMHDGSVQRVEDVALGDRLMGPDGTPRTALQLARGYDEMVEIRPTKGAPWVVNIDHVLTLVETGDRNPGRVTDVTVREWMTWSRAKKHVHKLFRVGVEFDGPTPPPINPYVLGVLLGDGSLKRGVTVTAADREIWAACEPEAARWGMRFVPLTPADRCHGFKFASKPGPGMNRMLDAIGRLGLRVDAGEKFIPDAYKRGLRGIRLEVLAGLLDTDGHLNGAGYELTSKSRVLVEDAAFVARSLGLAAYVAEKHTSYSYRGKTDERTFWRVSISGDCSVIPCRVFRKRCAPRQQKKDVLRTGFTAVPTGTTESYFGFALDGDQRYVLGDFTVTHNTGKTVSFAELARLEVQQGGRVLIVVHRDELIKQARRKCEAVGLWPDVEKGKQRANTLAKVVLASVQSLRGQRLQRWARTHFSLVIIDEAHHAVAKSYRDVINHFDAAKIVGVTATPDRADGQALGDVFDGVAYRYEIRQAIAEGYLVPIVARRVVVDSVDLSTVATRAGDFAQDQLADVMGEERTLRGCAVPLLELARDRQTIGFCVDVAHAHKMAAVMNSYRPGCARAVDGETDDDDRERLLGDTLDESRRNGKADCLILDFTGTAGKHKLVGPADCLAGSGELADDVREEIDRLLGTAQLQLDAVITQADDEVRKRREAMQIAALVKYHAEFIDPFVGEADQQALPPCDHRWHRDDASQAQLKALEDDGVNLDKLPKGFSRADAWNLLARIRSRDPLCSYKQAKRLHGYGIDTRQLTKKRASELIGMLAPAKWHPSAIENEPEVAGRRDALPLRRANA